MQLAETLPSVNALLNATSAALLAVGYWAIRTRRVTLHRRLMLSALGASGLFLVSYLTRVALTGTHRYPGEGWDRALYLAILASHTLLAAAALPLILRTLWLALVRARFEAHRRIARVALPVWLYVSLTGVVVYLMLYRF